MSGSRSAPPRLLLAEQKIPPSIHSENQVEVLEGWVLGVAHLGSGDQNVRMGTEGRLCGLEECLDLGLVGYVGLRTPIVVLVVDLGGGEVGWVDNEFCAQGGEVAGDGLDDAGGAIGDDCDAILEWWWEGGGGWFSHHGHGPEVYKLLIELRTLLFNRSPI
ncbi:hypothetical protein Acr_01g0005160 [Actinidia rufa]|uniref:Uncharacterized protein n=1 Tax=Actinidia rufa TaxID=165716 RepID=A0A7J0E4W3_9ERIC|nr:hypothetical protein Acr_01g0005160 [Actinidia rufa]